MKPNTTALRSQPEAMIRADELHPGWQALIRLCKDLGHGEIERIRIQDGLPVLVEVTRQKIKLI